MAPARKRLFNSSSSSEGYEENAFVCSIDEFIAGKERFRVAPTGVIPLPLPMKISDCRARTQSLVQTVSPEIVRILRSHWINGNPGFFSVSNKNTQTELLLVETRDDDPSTWKIAADKIKAFLVDKYFAKDEISIEIRNSALTYSDRSMPINSVTDFDAFNAINEVQEIVIDVAKTVLHGSLSSIAWHMRKSRNQDETPKPTAMMYCHPESRHGFVSAEKQIGKYLEAKNHPGVSLHLEILPGSIQLASPSEKPRPVILRELSTKPENGSSIGLANNCDIAGTLGGWVLVRLPTGVVKQCFMTCWHVIGPGDSTNIKTHKTDGIGLGNTALKSKIEVTYPSLLDLDGTSTLMRSQIADPSFPAGVKTLVQNTIETLDKLGSDGMRIGTVLFASGIAKVTNDKHKLDWALVETLNTMRKNTPPVLTERRHLDGFTVPYDVSGNDTITTFAEPKLNEWVGVKGRTTMGSGHVNSLRREVLWGDKELPSTSEIELMSSYGDFCERGDSGTWVVNSKKEVIGMLIGKDAKSSDFDVGLMTPISAIIADIKARTGCDIRLP